VHSSLNFDPGFTRNKWNPFPWNDPVTGENMIVFREADAATPAQSDFSVWREDTIDGWVHELTFAASDISFSGGGTEDTDRPFILSPEPFEFSGKSYIGFSSADALLFADQFDGNMWVARLDTDFSDGTTSVRVDWLRQINERPTNLGGEDYSERPRLEAEVYEVSGSGGAGGDPTRPIIFFSTYEEVGDDAIHSCGYTGMSGRELRRFVLSRGEICSPDVAATGVCS
jgi:hypothetical protein